MVNILTDSTADLGRDLAERFGLHVLPLYVHLGEKAHRDGVGITTPDLFRYVESTGQLPKTSAPSEKDFEAFFSQPGEWVFIGISNRLSATYQTALLAREACGPERIHVVDSRNLSSGIGLLAILAAGLRDDGLPGAEIAARVQAATSRVRTSFVIETLDYLHKGGRCSAMQNIVGSLLQIRPIIAVQPDGTLGVKARTRGARRKALQSMLDSFVQDAPAIDTRRVFITHTGCHADADLLKHEIMAAAAVEEVCITGAGSVIASHCGPDTIGILYMLQQTE